MSNETEDLFLNTKPVRALVVINNPVTESYASQVSSKIETTYAHTVKILKKLDNADLINKSEDGRKVIAETTEKGKRVARRAQQLRAEIKDQSVQSDLDDTVFQAEEWNIMKSENGWYIDCLSGETASLEPQDLEKAANRLAKPET